MSQRPAIKQFVRHTLGCTCPDEVFDVIESKQLPDGATSLGIGGRLLVHIVNVQSDEPGERQINDLLNNGVRERNAHGFNRFRLVLVSQQADRIEGGAKRAFQASSGYDERTHLHVIDQENSPLITVTSRNTE